MISFWCYVFSIIECSTLYVKATLDKGFVSIYKFQSNFQLPVLFGMGGFVCCCNYEPGSK